MAKKGGCGKGALGCLIVLIAGFFAVNALMKSDWKPKLPAIAPWHERENVVGAYIHAQQVIGPRLPRPDTAEWPGDVEGSRHVVPWEDQHYVVRSWVEAENAEGRRVRYQYTVKLVQVGDDEWKLLDHWIAGL